MVERKKKHNLDLMEARVQDIDLVKRHQGHGPIRRVNPLGMRVLVRIRTESNQTEGGLYLPEGAKQNMQESLLAEVVEVARAEEDDESREDANISGIPLGALVLIPKGEGTRVPWDDSLRIIETMEVLAIVTEISIS